eukprot:gene34891-45150_t
MSAGNIIEASSAMVSSESENLLQNVTVNEENPPTTTSDNTSSPSRNNRIDVGEDKEENEKLDLPPVNTEGVEYFFAATLLGQHHDEYIEFEDMFEDLVFQACAYSTELDDLQFIFIKQSWLEKCPMTDETNGNFTGTSGPRLDISTEVIVKSRVQLSSTDMLRLRKGHLSSFRPAAGDLIQYLFLHLLKEIATSLFMKFMLSDADEEEDVNQVISPPKKKRKVTDKQKQAMKNLSGFLSEQISGSSSTMGEGTNGGEDHRGGDDDGGAGSGAGTKEQKGSKKKKQAAVKKVTPFTPTTTAHTPAVEKRIKATGAGKGGRKPTKRKQQLMQQGNPMNHGGMGGMQQGYPMYHGGMGGMQQGNPMYHGGMGGMQQGNPMYHGGMGGMQQGNPMYHGGMGGMTPHFVPNNASPPPPPQASVTDPNYLAMLAAIGFLATKKP